ncbi:MAG: Ig-like domain-containing protein [Dehalococcoidia bacterium]|jgi:hypothetical protein
MKHTKMVLLMVVPALVVLFFGGSMRPPAAQATPIKVITLTDVMCLTMNGAADWIGDGQPLTPGNNTEGLTTCSPTGGFGGLTVEHNFRTLTRVVRHLPFNADPNVVTSETNDPQPEDFAKTDVDLGQLHQDDQTMYVVAFVGNDDPVSFYVDAGVFLDQHGNSTGKSSISCGPAPLVPSSYDFTDPDCDKDPSTVGDGVVVAAFQANGADRGHYNIRVRQDHIEVSEPYQIVGEPDKITFKPFDPAIQTGAPACELFSDTPSFLAIEGEPETSPTVATVTDDDGTAITGAIVVYTAEDPENPGSPSNRAAFVNPYPLVIAVTPTLDLQALGVGSPEVLCGGDEAGTVKLTATITDGTAELGAALDPGGAGGRSARVEYPVQGPPDTMVLSASPASLACDGTSNTTVSATLTDADGKPVVNGNRVSFDVQTLASANPLDGRSAAGVATSAITPLAGLTSGVVVHATWDRHVAVSVPPTPPPNLTPEPTKLKFVASPLEQDLLVSCEAPASSAPPAEVPSGPPSGAPSGIVISAPNTGDGGSGAPSWWLALPLGLTALLLMGSGLALRRRAR